MPEHQAAPIELLATRFGNWQQQGERAQRARGMFEQAIAHSRMNQPFEEVATYDDIVKNFGTDDALVLREIVSAALFNKGVTLSVLNRPEHEVRVYRQLLDWLQQRIDSRKLRSLAANAWFNLALAQARLGHTPEEIAAYETLLQQFETAPEPLLRERVAQALMNLALAHAAAQRPDAELQCLERLLAHWRDSHTPRLAQCELAARAWRTKAERLTQLGRTQEARSTYAEAIASEPVLLAQVNATGAADLTPLHDELGQTKVNFAALLLQQAEQPQDSARAVALLDDLLAQLAARDQAELQPLHARALFLRGCCGEVERRAQCWRELFETYHGDGRAPVRHLVARALYNLGSAQADAQVALNLFETVLTHFGRDSYPGLRELAAKAQYASACVLAADLPQDACMHFEHLAAQLEHDLTLAPLRALAVHNAAWLYLQLGELDAAIQTFDLLVRRYEYEPDLVSQALVCRAYLGIGVGLLRFGRIEAAIATLEEALSHAASQTASDSTPDAAAAPQASSVAATTATTATHRLLHAWLGHGYLLRVQSAQQAGASAAAAAAITPWLLRAEQALTQAAKAGASGRAWLRQWRAQHHSLVAA